MAFNEFKLTNEGRALHIKAINGDSITFTRVAFGDGAEPINYLQMTALDNEIERVPITSYDDTNKNLLNLKWELDTSKINNDFIWREYALFAQDNAGNEVLYAYAYDKTPVTITKMETGVISIYVGYITVAITDTDNISVSIGEYDTVTVNQFKGHTNDVDNPHKVTSEQVGLGNVENVSVSNAIPVFTEASKLENINSGEKNSTLWGKVKKAISTLMSHIGNFDNPHGVTWSQLFRKSKEPLAVEYGGTGVNSIEALKKSLNKDIVTDFRPSVVLSNNVYNNYDDGYWKQNGTAYIIFSGRISIDINSNNSALVMKLPGELRPRANISFIGQTNLQNGTPTISIRICTNGDVYINSFGYINLPSGTFIRFNAVYPTN